jgi:Lamin Tail Domain/Divergent InlB B-repeat domain
MRTNRLILAAALATALSGAELLAVGAPATAQAVSPLIISEFRLRGPNGSSDEYIELYNPGSTSVTVSTADGSVGWALVSSSAAVINDGIRTPRFVVPNGTVIPGHGHYLGTNSLGYSLAGYPAGNDGSTATTATGDASYATDIPLNAGIALFKTANPLSFTADNQLDAVGSTTEASTLYKEGTGYPPIAASTPHPNDAFLRDLTGGAPADTGNNVSDFRYVNPQGTDLGAGSRLGAPGPENRTSPVAGTGLSLAAVAPCAGATQAPNTERSTAAYNDVLSGSGTYALGTVKTRVELTNETGAAISRLRFRIGEVTSFPAPASTADLRLLSSSNDSFANPCGGSTTSQGVTLEQPPTQTSGGAWNSSVSAGTITLASPLPAGGTIDVNFLFGVRQEGAAGALLIVEALPNGGALIELAGTVSQETGLPVTSFPVISYTLTVTRAGQGRILSRPPGIKCGPFRHDCSEDYDAGTSVELRAQPQGRNTVFAGWSGDCSGTDRTCVLTMHASRSVTATFTKI